ncbi:hypothetical protein ACFJGW_02890 [Burkholderiaceae bacterium UC74_6]
MKFRPGPTSPAAWCRLGAFTATALALAGAPTWAAPGSANVSATVVEAVPIGLPASALDLYLQRLNPSGPFIGSVLVRVIGGIGDEPVALQLPSRQAVPTEAPLTLEGGPAMLGQGLAMAVTARMSKEQASEDQPVAITIAFN